jgi:hypothetical protein
MPLGAWTPAATVPSTALRMPSPPNPIPARLSVCVRCDMQRRLEQLWAAVYISASVVSQTDGDGRPPQLTACQVRQHHAARLVRPFLCLPSSPLWALL